jgi:general stress protein 26
MLQSNQQNSGSQLYNFTTEEAHSIHEMKIHVDVHVMYTTTDKT